MREALQLKAVCGTPYREIATDGHLRAPESELFTDLVADWFWRQLS